MRYSTASFIKLHALVSTDAVLLPGRGAVYYVRVTQVTVKTASLRKKVSIARHRELQIKHIPR